MKKVVGAALAASLLAGSVGCSGTTEPAGETVKVPVLWVTNSDGTVTGGTSTATVDAKLTGTNTNYTVNVQGAGSADTGNSWKAAAAMASAVGVLYSGQDPRGVQTSFEVSDEIDGSSAGGVLTVGVIAAMSGLAIDPKVAMTGTIGPDGSIGHVDGIEAKVRGAAQAGYTTVLIPAASVDADGEGPGNSASATDSADATTSTATNGTSPAVTATSTGSTPAGSTSAAGTDLNPETLGNELGISVTSISTVDQAVEAFTGAVIAPAAAEAPPLTDSADVVAANQAAAVISAVEQRLAANTGDVTADQNTAIANDVDRARALAAAGDTMSAYAVGLGTLLILDEAIARQSTTAAIAEESASAVADRVLADSEAVIARAELLLAEQSRVTPSQDPVRRYATINAATWLTRSIAVLRAINAELTATDGSVASQVIETAQVVAQYAIAVDRIYPDSMQIVELLNADPDANELDVTSFINAYTGLLASAVAANQAYYEGVLTSIAANPDLTFSQPGHTYAAVQQLQTVVTPNTTKAATHTPSTPVSGSASVSGDELGSASASVSTSGSTSSPVARAAGSGSADVDCAWAVSYFLTSSALVADEQDYDLSGSTIGNLDLTAGRPAALSAAFASSAATVDAFTARLAEQGVAVDHPVWTSGWGTATATNFVGQPQETAAEVLGLSLTWDAAVESFMSTAALAAARRAE